MDLAYVAPSLHPTCEMLDEKSLFVSELSVYFELWLSGNVEAEVIWVLLLNRGSEFVERGRWKTRDFVQNVEDARPFAWNRFNKVMKLEEEEFGQGAKEKHFLG